MNVTSSGSATLWVTDRFEAKTSTGGRIAYKGEPAVLRVSEKFMGGSIARHRGGGVNGRRGTMESFLGEVAADLYARYGEELSQRAVLFPSRRARLFFTDALARIAGGRCGSRRGPRSTS